jgi:hypothetical protein
VEGAGRKSLRLGLDPETVAVARRELREIVRGNATAEAAVESFNDWEAVRALERLWAVADSDGQDEDDDL